MSQTPEPSALTLTAAELVEATGKRRAASQAAVLAERGCSIDYPR